MKRSEITNLIFTIVSDEFEMPIEVIKSSSRKSDVVDARCLVATLMREAGLNNEYIKNALNKSTIYSVSQLLDSYDNRHRDNAYFRASSASVHKRFYNENKVIL